MKKVIISGWHTLGSDHATTGDWITIDLVIKQLQEQGIETIIAYSTEHLTRDDIKLWITGPVDPSYKKQQELISIDSSNWILCNTTLIEDRSNIPYDIDVTCIRDRGNKLVNTDLAVLAPKFHQKPIISTVCLRGYQPEYRQTQTYHDELKECLMRKLEKLGIYPIHISTKIPNGISFEKAAFAFEDLIKKTDIFITSRLHGLIHSLRAGRLPIVIEEVQSGGKVSALCKKYKIPFLAFNEGKFTDNIEPLIQLSLQPNSEKYVSTLLQEMQKSARSNLSNIVKIVLNRLNA
jgi:hypothetical protein